MSGKTSSSSKESAWDALLGDFDDEASTIKIDPAAFKLRLSSTSTSSTAAANVLKQSSGSLGQEVKVQSTPPAPGPQVVLKSQKTVKAADIDEMDDDFNEMLQLSKESEAIRKPLELRSDTPVPSSSGADKQLPDDHNTDTIKFAPISLAKRPANDIRIVDASLDDLEADEVEDWDADSPASVQPLSNRQISDLESFLNDDASESSTSANVKTSFGSFLSPNAAKVKSKGSAGSPSKSPASRRRASTRGSNSYSSARSVNIADLPKKKHLDFGYGQELPAKNWGKLLTHCSSVLTWLSLANNNLSQIPGEIRLAEQLTHLDISMNRLTAIPECISYAPNLRSLNASHNDIKSIEHIAKLEKLEELNLFRNSLTSFGKVFSGLLQLKYLDISSNLLTVLPRDLGECCQLLQVDASGNDIETVECNFRNMERFEKLMLTDNQIAVLSRSLLDAKVESIDLSRNRITSISANADTDNFKLKELLLIENLITEIPASFSHLVSLVELDIRDNPVQFISPSVGTISTLKFIYQRPTDIKAIVIPPPRICEKGTDAIQEYLRGLLKGTADPETSFAFGSGLAAQSVVCAAETFTIKAVDKFGVHKTCGGDQFSVSIDTSFADGSTKSTLAEPVDCNDGSYVVKYDSKQAGKYEIRIHCDGHPIKGSPYRVHYEPSLVSPTSCRFQTAPFKMVAGEDMTSLIIVCDEFGNVVNSQSKDLTVKATCLDTEHATTFKSTISLNRKKGIELIYNQTKTGSFSMQVKINGLEIQGSPFDIEVQPGPSFAKSCTVKSIGGQSIPVNQAALFVIHSRDRYNNYRHESAEKFKCMVHTNDGKQYSCEISESVTIYEFYASFTPKSIGRVRLNVEFEHDGKFFHVSGSPLELVVSENRDSRSQQAQDDIIKLKRTLDETNVKYQELLKRFFSTTDLVLPSPVDGNALISHIFEVAGSNNYFVTPVFSQIVVEILSQKLASHQLIEAESFFASLQVRILKVISNEDLELEALYFWLSNLLSLRIYLHSAEDTFAQAKLDIDFDVSCAYQKLVKSTQNWISPTIVTALTETYTATSSPQVPSSRNLTRKFQPAVKKPSFQGILDVFTATTDYLERHCIPKIIQNELISQIYVFIDAIMFNSIMLRKTLCNSVSADIINTNIKNLRAWSLSKQTFFAEPRYTLAAVQLLKLPIQQFTADDYEVIINVSGALNCQQVEKLLRNANDSVSEELIAKITAARQASQEPGSVQIFLDTFRISALDFSKISGTRESVSIPSIVKEKLMAQIT